MKTQFTSLLTSNADDGLLLARQLADQLCQSHEQARTMVARPGGTNYLLPPNLPVEMISSILFYAIAAANNGWTSEVK